MQPQGTNLCGYYVCEFIHTFTTECRTNELDHMLEKLLPHQRLLAIQEELAGFLLKEVIDEKHGRFHVNRKIGSSCNCNDLHVIERRHSLCVIE
jgi:hypothetical protein